MRDHSAPDGRVKSVTKSSRSHTTRPLRIRGARENNLQGISLDLPNGELVAVAGASGAGKSSLVHQVIARVGRRRLGRLRGVHSHLVPAYGPRVESVDGLLPCVEVRQDPLRGNARSTIATYSGVLDLIASLFVRHGESVSPCGAAVQDVNDCDFSTWLLRHFRGRKATLARVTPEVNVVSGAQLPDVERLFFRDGSSQWRPSTRRVLKGELPAKLWLAVPECSAVIKEKEAIPRIVGEPSDSWLWIIDDSVYVEGGFHRIADDDPEPYLPLGRRLFSFNSQALGNGQCDACLGLGVTRGVSEASLVRDFAAPILEDGLNLPRSGERFTHLGVLDCTLRALLRMHRLPIDATWNDLPDQVREVVLYGSRGELVPELRASDDQLTKARRPFLGICALVVARSQSAGAAARAFKHLVRERNCLRCGGSRFNRSARACSYRGKSLGDMMTRLTLGELRDVVRGWIPTSQQRERKLLASLDSLLSVYVTLNLGYLQLGRSTSTLSGGEAQRIRLGLGLALQLCGCCYLLDEPSRGLHARDVADLTRTITRLCDNRNTVVVVEHNPIILGSSDHLVVLGPCGGTQGGRVVYEGDPRNHEAARKVRPQASSVNPKATRNETVIAVSNLSINNVRAAAFQLPVGRLTAVVGVSGAGKSSAILKGLVPAAQARLDGTSLDGNCSVRMPKTIRFVEVVAQKLMTQSRRSIIATTLEIHDQFRSHYASQDTAQGLGLKAADFSFNSDGACSPCEGTGLARDGFGDETEDTCHVCAGSRLGELPLLVRSDGLTIADLLSRTAEELAALRHSAVTAEVQGRLELMRELGLGHLQLSRTTATLSAGERQRLGVVRFMARIESHEGQGLLVLDEPTAGLGAGDAQRVFQRLAELARTSGHSLVVIEHKLELLTAVDWIIEFGPAGGPAGGRVVFEGTFSQLLGRDTPSSDSLRAGGKTSARRRPSSELASSERSDEDGWVRDAEIFEVFAANQEVRESAYGGTPVRAAVTLDAGRYPDDIRVAEFIDVLPLLRVRCTPDLPAGVIGFAETAELEDALCGKVFSFSPVSLQLKLGLVTPTDLANALRQLSRFGFNQASCQGKRLPLSALTRKQCFDTTPHDVWVIAEDGCDHSLRSLALRWSGGVVRIVGGADDGAIFTTQFLPSSGIRDRIGTHLNDPHVGDCRSPNGRCAYCTGTGRLPVYPLDLIIADQRSAITQDAFWHPSLLNAIRSLRRTRIIPEGKFFAGQQVADFLQPYSTMSDRTAFLFEHGIPWRRFLKPAAARADRTQDYFSWRGLHDYAYMVIGKIKDQRYKQRLKDGFRLQVCPHCRGTGAGWESNQLVMQTKTLLQVLASDSLSEVRHGLGVSTPAVDAALKIGLGHLRLAATYSELIEQDRSRLLVAASCSAPLENLTLLLQDDGCGERGHVSTLLARQGMAVVRTQCSKTAT